MKRTIIIALLLASAAFAAEDKAPELTKLAIKNLADLPETPNLSWNLGPTGARGWIYGAHGNRGTLGHEILVTAVEKGSPANGVLQPFDVLLGANGRAFTADARRGLGAAITVSEATGVLRLTRWRDGKTSEVELRLEVFGAYSATAPFTCAKSQKIFEQACRFLAEQMPPEGFTGVGGCLDGLLLLASGRPEYLDHVRRTAYRVGPPKDRGLSNWGWSYDALLLAEYHLATGDTNVVPWLAEYARVLAAGQAKSGSWGHNPAVDGMTEGYGEVNAVGLICFMSLVLTKECGVKVDEAALARSMAFFRKYTGRGTIPYGDHEPWLENLHDNGKNGMTAVVYDLLN